METRWKSEGAVRLDGDPGASGDDRAIKQREARKPESPIITAISLPAVPGPHRLNSPCGACWWIRHRIPHEERVLGHRHASFQQWAEVEASEAANNLAKCHLGWEKGNNMMTRKVVR